MEKSIFATSTFNRDVDHMSNIINIAVVEDEQEFHSLYDLSFKKELKSGCVKIFHYMDGQEYIDDLENFMGHRGDKIVLSDINMPRIDGIELLKLSKKKYPALLVYLISAYKTDDYISMAKGHGADKFISKPINIMALKKELLALF